MKNSILFFFSILILSFVACTDKDDSLYADYLVAKPLTISKAEFKNSVKILPPRFIEESGKIYAYKNLIFINDKYQGVHVINNSNPKSPSKIGFIKIPGNVDISVKNDLLYADSLTDLVVIDISNMEDFRVVNRLENVLNGYVNWPTDVDIFENADYDYENEILIGWQTVTESRLISENQNRFVGWDFALINTANSSEAGAVGQGGSLARFKIVDDYLYAVDENNINIFNIQDAENPKALAPVFAGFQIETIFNLGENLFLGSRIGMYIYSISNPAVPSFVSEFTHGTACDPVVADENYAYVTLRGGNFCGAAASELLIIDIKNLSNPTLLKSYPMDGPYGLGIKDNKIFVCDGNSGLKVYDKTDVMNLKSLNHFKDIQTFDVIPLENNLLMVGDEMLYQYEYLENKISLLSSLSLK
ncbi:MAG: hypothetical protein NWQ38_10830 [Cellulophaga sp.]|nr:hypothetical protein [Cellulophaga sp.]